LRGPADWRQVPIDPVDEALVEVAAIHRRIIDDPRYFADGRPGARPRSWVRSGVAERLERVVQTLPRGVSLIVWDGWRSVATQASLYDEFHAALAREHPEWDGERLDRETMRFVSAPSVDPACPAPHVTGGAVDVALGTSDGAPFDFGTPFDAFVPEAAAGALESVPGEPRERRRQLFWAMADQGFTAYVEEWWHFDFGDQFWGAISGQGARYGPTEPPE
jgi:D-alanyl-D-alanine dipeptidase